MMSLKTSKLNKFATKQISTKETSAVLGGYCAECCPSGYFYCEILRRCIQPSRMACEMY